MTKQLKTPNYREKGATYLFECQKCGAIIFNSAIPYGICTECGEDHNKYLSAPDLKELGIQKEVMRHEKSVDFYEFNKRKKQCQK
jgi:uncharacterized Zn finger protein